MRPAAILCSVLFCTSGLLGAGQEDPVALFEAGRFEVARAGFLERLSVRPEDPDALYYLGRLTSEVASSRAYFERLLKADPDHDLADDALFELAEAEYAGPAALYLTARSGYRAFLERYPDSRLAPRALYRIGLTYLVTRQPDSAAVMFREVTRRFPDSGAAPYARLGEAEAAAQGGAVRAVGEPAGRFWVRVGAFRQVENLQRLSGKLAKAGFQVRQEGVKGGGLHLLLVGAYPNREAAEVARRWIETAEGLQCQVEERR